MSVLISKGEYLDWLQSNTTQTILKMLSDLRREWESRLIDGYTLENDDPIRETARAVGIIYGLNLILEMEVED